jgi:RNA polymerase nonessential primary-like sigma factor
MKASRLRITAITRDEEIKLYEKFRAGDVGAGKRIIVSCLPLVRYTVNRYYQHLCLGGNDVFDSLTSAGYEALMRALRTFNPYRGMRFATFAKFFLHRNMRDEYQKFSEFCSLRRTLAFTPKNPIPKVLSFSSFVGKSSDEEYSPLEFLPAEECGDYLEVESHDIREQLHEALKFLTPVELHIITHRFGLSGKKSRTLKFLADERGVTGEYIRQIQVRALSKLKEKML